MIFPDLHSLSYVTPQYSMETQPIESQPRIHMLSTLGYNETFGKESIHQHYLPSSAKHEHRLQLSLNPLPILLFGKHASC